MKKNICVTTIYIIIFVVLFCFLFYQKPLRERSVVDIDNKVAELTIYTFDGEKESVNGLANLGHSFLSVYNTSQEILILGQYKIMPEETVCIGTWSINQFFGVWYNVESNYIRVYNKYNGRISVTKNLSQENIETINSFIDKNNTWNPLKNCSFFAINLWNSVAFESEKFSNNLIYLPSELANQIKTFDDYEINKQIETEETFGYFENEKYIVFNFEGGENV